MIRPATHAGSFYPRFAKQISDQIEQWTRDQKKALVTERTLGIVVPHAGYMYSGACAATAYHHISAEAFDAFLILHPCHHAAHFEYSVSAYTEYETPLGNLKLDTELYDALSGPSSTKHLELRLHEAEHSMEIQLPLIKHYFPTVSVCPVMIGRQTPEVMQALAHTLNDLIVGTHRRIGIIVSTDLSHYHNAKTAEELDSTLIKHFLALDPDAMWQAIRKQVCEACGIGGVLSLLYLADLIGGLRTTLLSYTHSGKVSGINHQVVGYFAAKVHT